MQLSIGVGCVLYATALTLKDSRAGFLAKHSDRMHVCNHLLAHLHPSAISRLPVVSEKTMIHRKSGGLGSFAALDRGEVCTKLMCSCLREIGRKRAPSRKALLKDVSRTCGRASQRSFVVNSAKHGGRRVSSRHKGTLQWRRVTANKNELERRRSHHTVEPGL